MKKIIENKPTEEITVSDVCAEKYMNSKILFAYKSEGNSGWCFLAKLTQSGVTTKYGFVAMNYTNTHPRFVAGTMAESIKMAIKCRDVYAFNGVEELAYAITNKL
jgi:hypothetical protein